MKLEANFLKPPKICKKDPKQNNLSNLELFCLRFPVVSEYIFKIINDQTLAKCKEISRTMRKFYNMERFYWIRIIQKYRENQQDFTEDWSAVTHRTPIETVKELANATQEFFQFDSSRYEFQLSPLHIAAERGLLGLCQFITQKTGEINPRVFEGTTPLHMAAYGGHVEICLFIMEKLENKNPGNNDGWTSLHYAAQEGHLEVCRAIMEKLENKNPADKMGWTPLHYAANGGHLEVCRSVMKKLDDKSPRTNAGNTPKDLALQGGHLWVVQLITVQIWKQRLNRLFHW